MSKFSEYSFDENRCQESEVRDAKNDSEKYEKIIDKYSKLSEQELLQEFISLTASKKKMGTLGNDELEKIKGTLSPYLSNTQKMNLDRVIDVIKDV